LENLNELEDEINDSQAESPAGEAAEPQEDPEEAEDHLPFEAKEDQDQPRESGSGELDIF
jgi:hypothetical protein